MATSTVGNHSSGAQTLHSGKGAQSINTGAGVLLNVDKYIAIHNAEGSLDLVRSLFSDKEHGADGKSLPAQPSTADIVAWLRSLSPLEFYDIHTSQLKQRTAGTGEWLLKKKKFQTWKDGPDRILWLDGIIGAGKSMLASIITDHLEKEIGTANNNKACVYTSFKFHDDNEAQPTIEILVANLLMQLVRQQKTDKVHQKLVEAYHSFQSHEGSLGQEELKTLVEIQVKAFSSVFLIIDALENCSNDPSTGIREAFVKLIRKLPENCKILVTSRSGMSIGRQFEASQRIKLQASPADIKLYVQNRIRTNDEMLHLVKDGMSKNPGFEDDISAIIIKKAQGIFLLATMHMDYLATQETLGHFRTALGKLPEDPALSFSAAIQRIEKQSGFQKKLAKHVISWVLSAARPLTAGEVRHAFAVEWQEGKFNIEYLPDEDRLTSVCAGLIVIDPDTKILRPVHDSVLAHLRSFPMIPVDQQRHADMGLRCITYLGQTPPSIVSMPEHLCNHPLLKYAAIQWFHHATRAGPAAMPEGQITKFLQNTPMLSASFQVRAESFPKGITGLHAAAYFDMPSWAELLLRDDPTEIINTPCGNGQTPLHWAARYNRTPLVELLIASHHAATDAQDNDGNTPLHLAVIHEHEAVVRLLLRHGAKPDVWNRKGWTPFRWAIRYGLRGVARPLAEARVEIDVEDVHRGTPLTWATQYMHLDLVRLLLENGWDVNWQAKDGWTALRHAVQFGSEPMARLLLEHRASVDLCDGQGGFTPLRWAVLYGHTAVVKILLENGADVNAVCKDGWTPLIQAGKGDDKSIVYLLVEKGARLDEQGLDGSTALHFAVKNQSKSILWLLLESGANVDLQDKEGTAALHLAVEGGDYSLVWYLVEGGADPDLANKEGLNSLHLAAKKGCDKIFQLLLEREMSIERQDKMGFTVLHHAAQGGHIDMVRILLKKGAILDTQDNGGLTALHWAARQGHDPIVEALVDGNADLNIQDKEGLTALHYAVRGGSQTINAMVKLIKGIPNLDIQDRSGRTALMHAAQLGDELAAMCLMKSGADGAVQDKDQWTARDHAANGKHALIVGLLGTGI